MNTSYAHIIFINIRIEKNEDTGKVVVSIIEAQTEVENGGRLGDTLANTMKKSQFEGRNAVSWTEQNAIDDDTAMKGYNIEGSLQLTLTIDLPSFLPIPVSRMIEVHIVYISYLSHIHMTTLYSLDLILSEARLFKRPVKYD